MLFFYLNTKPLITMTYLEKITECHKMVGEGQMLDAFEKFYHDDVVMVEATGEVRKGKDANREFEKNWMNGIKEMHGGGVLSINSNEDTATTSVESWVDLTFQDGNRMKMEEVAVQKWQGDQIIHERFYYNMPG
jgi:ketosteroid isomerase-like protein